MDVVYADNAGVIICEVLWNQELVLKPMIYLIIIGYYITKLPLSPSESMLERSLPSHAEHESRIGRFIYRE